VNELGHFAAAASWILALIGIVTGGFAGITGKLKWLRTSANATLLVFFTCLVSFAALAYGFLTDDYTNQYVWQFSNRDMSPIYKFSAIWGGMDGSMLLWCLMLTMCGALVAYWSSHSSRKLMSWVLAVTNSSSLFFLTMVVFVTNPFRYVRASFIPPDGNGLNPLLQNPLMAIHPPMLYAGFTIFSVPFAFCLGALFSGSLSNDWLRLTRRWTLVAWGFLTAGIVLGGHWAYVELGWGGFWAWDPVENASFLPWLTGSAFLHSVMVQERKNMLKVWNVWLIAGTYLLTVFGTFLTRSGVVQSVHAFASTDVGWVFLLYIGIMIALTLALTIYRRSELRSERTIESFLSREAIFLVNNLLFLGICFATLWGVMFPVLSEAITGAKQTVGIPFFNKVNVPLFLLLVFLMGVGPLLAWRKASWSSILKTFLWPALTASFVGVILIWAGIEGFYPILSYSLCWFVLAGIMLEMHRGMRSQRVTPEGQISSVRGLGNLLRRHRTRYAGYLVHIGVVIAVIGITASMAHKVEKEFALKPGESFQVGRFSLTLNSLDAERKKNYDRFYAEVLVSDRNSGKLIGAMHPELRSYRRNNETTTEVDLRTSLREDIYLVLVGTEGEQAALKLFINPLQVWLWIGTIVMIVGTLVALLPAKQSIQVRVVADDKEAVRT